MLNRLAAIALATTVCLIPVTAWAANINHPERQWQVLETPHFAVHFYQGEEQTARKFAAVGENNLPRLCKDFGISVPETDKIPIVVSRDNFFNGSAEPIKNRIELDPVLAAGSVVGTERFLAHELTHVVTFLALQSDGVSLSRLSNLGTMPSWFLEGIAQYEGEYWYTTNDRMLRLHTLDKTLLTNTARQNFPLLGVEGGAAGYNEGYSLVRYIFDTYGKDKISVLFKLMRDGKEPTFTRALEKAVNKPYDKIEAAWRADLKARYAKQIQGVQEEVPGSQDLVASTRGDVNVAPSLSPDGKKLAYLTSRHQDGFLYLRGHVMGFLTLALANPDGSNRQELSIGKGRVSGYSWSPDGSQIVVSTVAGNDKDEPTFDLFLYDVKTGFTKQLTHDANVGAPAWRPDSPQVAYTETHDGKTVLKLFDTKSFSSVDIPSDSLADRHATDLAWSPDGRTLVASVFGTGEGGKIASIDPLSGHVRMLTDGDSKVNETSPVYSPDGKSIVFASDRDSMQNLYKLTLGHAPELDQLTKVYTGASHPNFGSDGKLYYAAYRSIGADVRAFTPKEGDPVAYHMPRDLQPGVKVAAAGTTPVLDHQLPDSWKLHGYEPEMTNDIFMPEITSDEMGAQLGMMTLYSDVLDKQQLGLDVRAGIMSQRFSYMAQYINRMSSVSWGAQMYDTPTIGMAKTINPDNLYNSLYWERDRGLSLFGQKSLTGAQTLTASMGLSYVSALNNPPGGSGLGMRTGRLQSLSIAWNDQHIKGTSDSDINPSEGFALGASYTLSDHAIGSDFDFSQYAVGGARFFPILPDLRHNLTLSWNVAMTQGDAMPLFLGGVQGGGSLTPLRGYNVGSFVGNRLAYLGLDYTFPILQQMDYQFGPLYFNKLYGSAFVEAGDAWNQGDSFAPHATAGAELRIKTAFMGRQVVIFRIGVAQQLTPGGATRMYLTF